MASGIPSLLKPLRVVATITALAQATLLGTK